MVKGKKIGNNSLSTEEKIKEAARQVFLRKGFSAARTRDIAAEAGINLALLNYYFRSKQKLFDEVMKEKIQTLLKAVIPVFQDPSTTLDQKIKLLVLNYTNMLKGNTDLPIFVLNELRKKNTSIVTNLPGNILLKSSFIKQLKQQKKNINPVHFLLNLVGLIIFPFIVNPVLIKTGLINEREFQSLIQEREKFIPLWMDAILK